LARRIIAACDARPHARTTYLEHGAPHR
jgi:hypothetical protein